MEGVQKMSQTVAKAEAQRIYNLIREVMANKNNRENIKEGVEYVMIITVIGNDFQLAQVGVMDERKIMGTLCTICKKIDNGDYRG